MVPKIHTMIIKKKVTKKRCSDVIPRKCLVDPLRIGPVLVEELNFGSSSGIGLALA